MADVFAVANQVLTLLGPVSSMKLQKLVFYSDAYHLVHTGEPLFPDEFEGWVNGPVCKKLYRAHQGKFLVRPGELPRSGQPLLIPERASVCRAVECLGGLSGEQLSALTHEEGPWKESRTGLSERDRGGAVIPKETVRQFYSQPLETNPLFSSAC